MKVNFDFGDVLAGIDELALDTREIAREMGVAVGRAMRDEAKAKVGRKTGKLADAIYLAYSDSSSEVKHAYTISWNRKKAPHGHLQEFGHWQTNVVVQKPNGQWITTNERLAQPRWVAANPFLRPAYMTIQPVAMRIAIAAGRKKYNELKAEG